MRKRLRAYGIIIGEMPTGPYNSITDVPGIKVGHVTLIEGEGKLDPGRGPIRTGITIVLPHARNIYTEKLPAAVHTINGYGKAVGFEQVRALGTLESPIALTNTLNVGLVQDGLISYMIKENPDLRSVNVLVAETNDSYLNDIQGRHVQLEHVLQAIDIADSGSIVEGSVGAGTGTMCFGWKGGIGTASRKLPDEAGGHLVGALLQTNFGQSRDLLVAGVPVGRQLANPGNISVLGNGRDEGSVIIVLATDAPLHAKQLERMCVRAGVGLARTGSYLGAESGDFVIAFSTTSQTNQKLDNIPGKSAINEDEPRIMNMFFRAVIESVEESVLNSLFCAETIIGRDGHVGHQLPIESFVL